MARGLNQELCACPRPGPGHPLTRRCRPHAEAGVRPDICRLREDGILEPLRLSIDLALGLEPVLERSTVGAAASFVEFVRAPRDPLDARLRCRCTWRCLTTRTRCLARWVALTSCVVGPLRREPRHLACHRPAGGRQSSSIHVHCPSKAPAAEAAAGRSASAVAQPALQNREANDLD